MKLDRALCAVLAAAVALGAETGWAQNDDRRDRDVEVADADDDLILAGRREELIREADRTLEQLLQQNELAAELFEQAYGHAVFDTTKGGLILTGAGGTGVARSRDGSDVTFMRLGAAGIGLGAGFENYKLVMLLEDEDTYSSLVTGQWDGALSAQASAGTEGVSSEEQFIGGVRAFRVTDGGLMAQIDATALRFWPIDRLNRGAEIEARIAAASGGEVPDEIEERLTDADASTDTEAATETDADIEADSESSNPERLDELAAENEDLGLFVEAVKAAGLADALTGDTEYTVFAPTNDAFESSSGMTREELLAPENREELIRLLRAHIVADDLDREMAGNIPEALTIDGGTVDVNAEGEEFTVGNASVVEADIERGNLRVHVVDDLVASPLRVAEAEPAEAKPDEAASPDDGEAASGAEPADADANDAIDPDANDAEPAPETNPEVTDQP